MYNTGLVILGYLNAKILGIAPLIPFLEVESSSTILGKKYRSPDVMFRNRV